MILTIIPQWGRPESILSVAGDVLTINGEAFDLSPVPDGGEAIALPLPGHDHVFVGPIRRLDGVIHATIIAHLGPDAAADQPDAPWTVPVVEGRITIPAALREETPE